MDEENFPRGGSDIRKQPIKEEHGSGDLFKEGQDAKKKWEGRKGQERDGKEKHAIEKHRVLGTVSGQNIGVAIEPLSNKSMYPGMLLLGCVRSIQNYSLTLALPNGLSGSVEITNICQAYTDSLHRFAEAQARGENVDEPIHTLAELFTVGMVVPCKLLDVDKGAKKKYKLSIDPQDIHNDFRSSSLHNGMTLFGSISSQEDHGYTVELGIKGVYAFLKNQDAERYIQVYNEGYPLKVGQCCMCGVQMKEGRMDVLTGQNRAISVTIDPKKLDNSLINTTSDVAFSSLIPGMKVKVKVETSTSEGVTVSFLKYKGSVHKTHLPMGPLSFTRGDKHDATILYVHPLSKAIVLSLQPHLATYTGVAIKQLHSLAPGVVIEDATVKNVDKKRGLFLKLTDEHMGFASLNNLCDEDVKDIKQLFPKGSTQRCRVLGFHHMEQLVIVTLKQSILDQKIMSLSDIHPGELIPVTVREIHEKGVSVNIRKRLTGFIPNLHLSDVTLKHPEKKFKEGSELKCRVLFVNTERSNVILTNKRSLIVSKFPLVVDYHQLAPGMLLEGFIHSIKDFGVFVKFYNDILGLVPRQFLSTERIENPETVFYKGQVVRCRVVSVAPDDQKLKLTFVLEGEIAFGKKKVDVPEDYEVGKCVKCKILRKSDKGVEVQLQPSEKKAILPRLQLADSMEMCGALWDMYRPGDTIKDAMFYNKTNVVLLTRKQSMLEASKNGEIVTEFEKLQLGMMLAGSVKNLVSYGVFVEFPGGLFGLVPNTYAADKRIPDLSTVYRQGQSVVAKVIELNTEKKRFLASLRMTDCYHGNVESGIDLIKHYLMDKTNVLKKLAKQSEEYKRLSKCRIGRVYSVTITEKLDNGQVACVMDNGMKAICDYDEALSESMYVGAEVDCVAINVDVQQRVIEGIVDKQLVMDINKRGTNPRIEKALVSQTIQARVLLIRDDFVMVALKGHAQGQLAYLPSRRHLNDILERHQFGAGQVNPVVIKSIEGEVIVASLTIHEDKHTEEQDKGTISHIPTHDIKLGDVVVAKVRKFMADQIYIDVKGTHGRIHITEMVDTIKNGTSPIHRYKLGDELNVKVIGFRDPKSWKFLPMSYSQNVSRSMPECSMRPSVLEAKKPPAEGFLNKVKVGDNVIAYVSNCTENVVWTQVTPGIHGKVYILNLSDDVQNVSLKQFRVGKGYSATVISVVDETLVELSFCEKKADPQLHTVTKGLVMAIKDDLGLTLQLGEGIRGMAGLTDLADDYMDSPTAGYRVGQLVWCYVLTRRGRRAAVSLRDSRVSKAEDYRDPEIQAVRELVVGQVLRGFVVRCTITGVFVRLGHNISGLAKFKHICGGASVIEDASSVFPCGKVVTCTIIQVDTEKQLVDISLLASDTGVTLDIPDHLIVSSRSRTESETSDASPVKLVARKRTSSSSSMDTDTTKSSRTHKNSKRTKTENLESSGQTKTEGDDADIQTGAEIEPKSDSKGDTNRRKGETPANGRKRTSNSVSDSEPSEKTSVVKKRKRISSETKGSRVSSAAGSETDSGVDIGADMDVKVTDKDSLARLDVDVGFSWDTDFKLPPAPSTQTGEISSDESDTEEIKAPVKKSKEELRQARIEEEKKLYEYERQTLEGERVPECAEDFDRLVLQSSDSSLVWLRYMAFHLGTSEIDKARAVAERALKTISFREEQEKMNVWMAYLNLENMYGNHDNVHKVLTRAIQQNEPLDVYTQMVNIYVKSGKMEEAEQLYNTLIKNKKYSGHRDVWVKFGQFYFQTDRVESARKLLQRSLKSLDNKHHVETIFKFAQMEFKHGEPERGKTMFENILSTYPKRTDLWSVYIDMVARLKETDATRSLFERVTNMKFSAKKMKFFFKRYLEFEQQNGDEKAITEVKDKAMKYVESQGYVDD